MSIREWWKRVIYLYKNDPVKKCRFHLETTGCVMVDSTECNYPFCDIHIEYCRENPK